MLPNRSIDTDVASAGSAISLFVTLASADAVGLLPSRAFDALFSPLFMLAVYVVSFVLSPWAAERFPINRASNETCISHSQAENV